MSERSVDCVRTSSVKRFRCSILRNSRNADALFRYLSSQFDQLPPSGQDFPNWLRRMEHPFTRALFGGRLDQIWGMPTRRPARWREGGATVPGGAALRDAKFSWRVGGGRFVLKWSRSSQIRPPGALFLPLTRPNGLFDRKRHPAMRRREPSASWREPSAPWREPSASWRDGFLGPAAPGFRPVCP